MLRRWQSLVSPATLETRASDELVEETGLEVDRIGPPVWTREHRFRIGTVDYHQAETVYLVRTSPFEASPRLTWDELAGEGMVELRWWLPSELFEYGGVFAPKRLPELITEVIELGPPEVPIEAGV